MEPLKSQSLKDPLVSVEEGIPVVLASPAPESTTRSWVVLFLAFGMLVATATCLSPEIAVLLLIAALLVLAPRKSNTYEALPEDIYDDLASRDHASSLATDAAIVHEQPNYDMYPSSLASDDATGNDQPLQRDNQGEEIPEEKSRDNLDELYPATGQTIMGPEEIEPIRENSRTLRSLCSDGSVENSMFLESLLEVCRGDRAKVKTCLESHDPTMELLVLNEVVLDAIRMGERVIKEKETSQEEDRARDNEEDLSDDADQTIVDPEELETIRENIRTLQSLCLDERVEASILESLLEVCREDHTKVEAYLRRNDPYLDHMEMVELCELVLEAIQMGERVINEFKSGQAKGTRDNQEDLDHVVDQTIVDPYFEKGSYTGLLTQSTRLPHGQGRMEYQGAPGKWYEGEWNQGRWHGQGCFSNDNGDFYKGELHHDQKHGHGTMKFADGRVFVGEYANGEMTEGKMTYRDGSTYQGFWKDGMRHGRGTCVFVDGAVYEGDFIEGEFYGQGKMTWADGGWYKGEWKNGDMEGHGKEIRPDGTLRHEGPWKKGTPARGWEPVGNKRKRP